MFLRRNLYNLVIFGPLCPLCAHVCTCGRRMFKISCKDVQRYIMNIVSMFLCTLHVYIYIIMIDFH